MAEATYYAKVRTWNECTNRNEEELVLLYATSFLDAIEQIENYYGDTLSSVDIHYWNDEYSLWHFDAKHMSLLGLE